MKRYCRSLRARVEAQEEGAEDETTTPQMPQPVTEQQQQEGQSAPLFNGSSPWNSSTVVGTPLPTGYAYASASIPPLEDPNPTFTAGGGLEGFDQFQDFAKELGTAEATGLNFSTAMPEEEVPMLSGYPFEIEPFAARLFAMAY